MGINTMSKLNTDALSGPTLDHEPPQEQVAADEVNGPAVEVMQAEEQLPEVPQLQW
jgi:hypothetical protein